MSKIVIVSDSNSGITLEEGKELGIVIVPMPFIINGEEYFEGISLTQEKFYQMLKDDKVDIHTSQPSMSYLRDLFTSLLKDYDDVIYIPMSSGLSSTCANASILAQDFESRVHVVDNQRISVTQKESVYEALALVKSGKSADEIVSYLMKTKFTSIIYIMVDTLKYLKKGGRVTPAAAALGSMLHIKPVLMIKGEKLDSFYKALNLKQAKMKMIAQVRNDLENLFKEEYEAGKMVVSVAHTENLAEAEKFKNEIIAAFPKLTFRFVDPLSLSVSCHIGPGSLAIALSINNYLK